MTPPQDSIDFLEAIFSWSHVTNTLSNARENKNEHAYFNIDFA